MLSSVQPIEQEFSMTATLLGIAQPSLENRVTLYQAFFVSFSEYQSIWLMQHAGFYHQLVSGIVATGPTIGVSEAGSQLSHCDARLFGIQHTLANANNGCTFALKTQHHEFNSRLCLRFSFSFHQAVAREKLLIYFKGTL